MAGYRRYGDVAVGDRYPERPLIFDVTAARTDAFLDATGNDDPTYREAVDGVRRAPSMLASVYLVELLAARRSPPGGIHSKQTIRFHRGIDVGETLSLQAHVVEKYIRKDRPYVVSDFEARGTDGALVASGRVTSIWGKDT